MKRIKGQKGNESKDLCQGKRQLPCFLKQAHVHVSQDDGIIYARYPC